MWIKICGLTTATAVQTAVDAQVSAVGFVFAPSKRQVTAEQAVQLAQTIPKHIARVAVLLHPTQALVDSVLQVFKPDILQTDWQDLAALHLPKELIILPVLRAGAAWPTPVPGRFLFEGPVSGVGASADWYSAASMARQGELILAGGLHAGNVVTAMQAVRPFGVDVSSGVESSSGVKDVEKIIEFVQAVKNFSGLLESV